MSGAESPSRMPRPTKERVKRWYDKRMRKKEYNVGDKMLMNNLRCEVSQARKVSSRRKRPPQVIYPSSYGVITLQ